MTKPPLILVADDDAHIVNVLAVKLKSAGFGVVCAHDGNMACSTNVRAMIGKPFTPRGVPNKVYERLNLTPAKGVARAS